MSKEPSFQEMISAIKNFRYPSAAAFVTIWWWDLAEAAEMKRLLTRLGYKVFSYKMGNEIEMRFFR